VYDLKILKNQGLIRKPQDNLVIFVDHSEGPTRKRGRPIDLPNPNYIAIHAAIAEVLNMSGAGRFFDELLDKFKDAEGKVPAVRSWPDLEGLILRENVARLFQSVKVH